MQLKNAQGAPVATATFDFSAGYATITVDTIGGGILTPNGLPGPDQDTLETGDAGKRVACGVING